MPRSSSTKKSSNKFRYSWHVTDLDDVLPNGGTPNSQVGNLHVHVSLVLKARHIHVYMYMEVALPFAGIRFACAGNIP